MFELAGPPVHIECPGPGLCRSGKLLCGLRPHHGQPELVSGVRKVYKLTIWEYIDHGLSFRLLATGLLTLSMPLGMVLGQGVTPAIVQCGADIPTMNIVWFVPTVITLGFNILSVTMDSPPSPPSRSAELASLKHKGNTQRELLRRYVSDLKSMFTNREFLVLFLVLGGAVGFINGFFTQLSQMMCARGYDNEFSGLCASLLLGTGFIGALASGFLVEKFGNIEQVTKLFFGIAVLFGLMIAQLLRESNIQAGLAVSFTFFGIFAFGMYPLGLELALEVTYPVDESMPNALIFMSGQIQGGILVIVSMFMEEKLSEADVIHDICPIAASDCDTEADLPIYVEIGTGRDHTNWLLLISAFMSLLCILFYFGFKTTFRRSEADKLEEINYEIYSSKTTTL